MEEEHNGEKSMVERENDGERRLLKEKIMEINIGVKEVMLEEE